MTFLWLIVWFIANNVGAHEPLALERDYPRLAALGTAIDYLVEHTSAEPRG